MEKTADGTKIELTWYERKQGIKLADKIRKIRGKEKRRQRREAEQFNAGSGKQPRAKDAERKKFSPQEQSRRNGEHTGARNGRHAAPRQQHAAPDLQKLGSLFDSSSLPADARDILKSFGSIIASSHPLNSKQRALLPGQIRELSHSLTDERSERRLGYMNQTSTLSAYVHYYLWWNIVRLTRLFANLPASFLSLSENDICLDIGSGPLTVPMALFIARPELRSVPLTWYCMDISQQALSVGEDIFLSVAAQLKSTAWKIIRVRGQLGTAIRDKARFITCANVFNEISQDAGMPPDFLAKKYAEQLLAYTERGDEKARFLVIEPGVPSCARLISQLRDAFIRRGFQPCSPCPHALLEQCPMDGRREGKWCNFAFTTEEAPAELKKISDAAKLAKERAVLSFVAVERKKEGTAAESTFRVASDPIRLPGGRTGYYACSAQGLLLVVTQQQLKSGECYRLPGAAVTGRTDSKSGALIVELDGRADSTRYLEKSFATLSR